MKVVLIYGGIMLFLIQIYNISVGATYNWDIILCVLGVAILAWVILIANFLRISKKFKNKEYCFFIDNSAKIEKRIRYTNNEILCFFYAVSNFEIGDNEKFLNYISQLKSKNMLYLKYFWQLVYNIIVEKQYNNEELEEKFYKSLPKRRNEKVEKILYLIKAKVKKEDAILEKEKEFIQNLHSEKIKNFLIT